MSSSLDVHSLIKALDNENNQSLMELDCKKISNEKKAVFDNLGLPRDEKVNLLRKLKYYRYIDGAHDLQYGHYIRWVSLRNPAHIKLTNGGIVCEIKVCDEGIHVVCKNNMNRMFQLNLSENLVFQRLSDQERVLLAALQYLND